MRLRLFRLFTLSRECNSPIQWCWPSYSTGHSDFHRLRSSHWIHRKSDKCWRCNVWSWKGGSQCTMSIRLGIIADAQRGFPGRVLVQHNSAWEWFHNGVLANGVNRSTLTIHNLDWYLGHCIVPQQTYQRRAKCAISKIPLDSTTGTFGGLAHRWSSFPDPVSDCQHFS